MKLLFFDLETTGTNPGKNGIHQISGEIVIDGTSIRQVQLHRKCLCVDKRTFKRPYRN